MIVSASYKTDIPAFYGAWFMNRLDAGTVRIANPYGGAERHQPLDRRAVDGFVFWTRNAGPFMEPLAEVARRGYPFVVQFTATGYPRALDAATIAADEAVRQIRALTATFGRRAVVWRYDPVVATTETPALWHEGNFARLAAALAGTVDEVVLSFVQIYAKTRRNLARAADARGFAWHDPNDDEKRRLLCRLAAIAAEAGIRPTLCAQRALLGGALGDARCIDPIRLSDVAGRTIDAEDKPHRKACGCARSVDIGAYDTCPHGCVYCYAVRRRDLAKRRFARHDAEAGILGPGGEKEDRNSMT